MSEIILPTRNPGRPPESFGVVPESLPTATIEPAYPPDQPLTAPDPNSQPVLAEGPDYFLRKEFEDKRNEREVRRKQLEEQGERIRLSRDINAWDDEDEVKPQLVQMTPTSLPVAEYRQLFRDNSPLNRESKHLISPAESNPVLQFPNHRIKRRPIRTWAQNRFRSLRRAA